MGFWWNCARRLDEGGYWILGGGCWVVAAMYLMLGLDTGFWIIRWGVLNIFG